MITTRPKGKKVSKTKQPRKPNKDTSIIKVENNELNTKQEIFCRYFVFNDKLRDNATLSYGEAYGYGLDDLPKDDAEYVGKGEKRKIIRQSSYDRAYNVCGVESFRLLKIPKINDRIVKLRNELLKDDVVDSELAKVIVQDEERNAKIQAIKEYNRMRKRVDADEKDKPSNVQFIQININEPNGTIPAKVRDQPEPKAISSVASITEPRNS